MQYFSRTHELPSTIYFITYVGQLVELAPTRKLFYAPKHPYTEALLSAIPDLDPDKNMAQVHLTGEIPNPANPPTGCRFHTRCPYAEAKCKTDVPMWQAVGEDHFVACHFADELTLTGVASPVE